MLYLQLSEDGTVQSSSQRPYHNHGTKCIQVKNIINSENLVGKKVSFVCPEKEGKIKIAVVCNYGESCGIATYSQMLLSAFDKTKYEIEIFAESFENCEAVQSDEFKVTFCWKRGQSLTPLCEKIDQAKPDFVFVQHEFGIFPVATHFLKFLEFLNLNYPYALTLHSVYEHLDKTICTSYIKNIIVHTTEGQKSLESKGHLGHVSVIPHGCIVYPDTSPLYNIFHNDYCIVQFGFGFEYKGVDTAIRAIHRLKYKHPDPEKYRDIYFCYLCSESPFTKNIHNNYHQKLRALIHELGLEENVTIQRGYLSDQHLYNFLKTAKLAIFPYRSNQENRVYAASGAVRKAMAAGIPVIASTCSHFDDIEGVVPRIRDDRELAEEIDRAFSDESLRKRMVEKNLQFVIDNSWKSVADRHGQIFEQIINDTHKDNILLHYDDYEVVEDKPMI